MDKERLSLEHKGSIDAILNGLSRAMSALRERFNRHKGGSETLDASPLLELETVGECIDELASGADPSSGLFALSQELRELKGCVEGLAGPIKTKIEDNVLFTADAAKEINYLFINIAGLIETTLNCLVSPNSFLVKYVGEEGGHILSQLQGFVDSHNERVKKGRCRPESSHIYTSMADFLGCLLNAVLAINKRCL